MIFGTTSILGTPHYFKGQVGNDCYDPYETFERTCADLDKEFAENSVVPIRIDGRLFRRVLEHKFYGAFLETAASTPLHLQPFHHPETKIIRDCLDSLEWMDELPDDEIETRQLYNIIMNSSTTALHIELLCGQRYDIMRLDDCEAVRLAVQQHRPQALYMLGLRPGFPRFVQWTVSRILHFMHKRKCTIHPHTEKYLLHFHGEMAFYTVAKDAPKNEIDLTGDEPMTEWIEVISSTEMQTRLH